jgi:asparagine synthase (glutamine-hydrolysing)
LDSSTLVACAAQTPGASLNCYSIAYKEEHGRFEQSGDDARYARQVAAHFGADFHEIVVEPKVASLLPKVVWHMDDPISDPSAIATYLISEAAANRVKVLLSGQGADEIFCGYRVHLAHKTRALLRLMPKQIREEVAPRLLKCLVQYKDRAAIISPGLLMAFCRFGDKMLRTSSLGLQEQYSALRSYLVDSELRVLLSPEASSETPTRGHADSFQKHFDRVPGEDFINQMLYVDAKTFLPDLNLAYSDKMSMACSIEVRVPFLDNEIVDFMGRVPPDLKIRGFNQKYILRKAMEGVLPKSVLTRRKAAFGLPIRSWFKNELREMLTDMLSEDRIRRRGLLKPAAVTRMIRDNETGERDYTLPLWGLLTLELWHQAFLDQRTAATPERLLA